jgi:hypothetical protein
MAGDAAGVWAMIGTIDRRPNGAIRLTVEFSRRDLIEVPLDRIDRMMLAEKQNGIADWLLDAELIARRLEQARI